MSYWDLGKRPKNRPFRKADVMTYQAVSTLESLDKAIDKAIAADLGSYVAELEVPDEVERKANGKGHVDLYGTTPGQLLGYVVQLHSVGEKR